MMTLMSKLFLAVLATFGVALGTAATASASEQSFISAVDSLDYYAIDCPGCAQDAVSVGYKACAGFAQGGSNAAVAAVLRAYNGPGQENAEYHATLFAQYAGQELCPQYGNEIGPI